MEDFEKQSVDVIDVVDDKVIDDKVVNADKTADVLNRTVTKRAKVMNVRFDIHNKFVAKDEVQYDEQGNRIVIRERNIILVTDTEFPVVRKRKIGDKEEFYTEKTKEIEVSAYRVTQLLRLLDFEVEAEMARLKEATNAESISVRTLMFFMMKSEIDVDTTTFEIGDSYTTADGTVKQYEHRFYRNVPVNVDMDEKYYARGLAALTAEIDTAIADAKAL